MAESIRFDWRSIVRLGLLAGVIALCLGVIGLVEASTARDLIEGVITLGHLMLFVAPVMAGYFLAQKSSQSQKSVGLVSALIAGLFSALPLIALVFLSGMTDLRELGLVNISPVLIGMLTFGRGSVVGSLILMVLTGILGLVGAVIHFTPDRIQRPVMNGLVGTLSVGLFSEIVIRVLRKVVGGGFEKLFFSSKSLLLVPAIVLFLAIVGFTVWWSAQGQRVRKRLTNNITPEKQRQRRNVSIVLGILLILGLPLLLDSYLAEVVDQVGLYILLGLGLNIVVGYAGLLDLGYVAFFAIGAYMMGVLTSDSPLGIGNMSFWMAVPICVLTSVTAGVLLGIPVLGMRGDYLAIVTMGFGEIIRILAQSDFLKPAIGGAQGIIRIPKPQIGGFILVEPGHFYYLIVLGCFLAIFVSWRLREARLGRQWMAMREDEDVAEAVGIPLVKTKLLAFGIGAAFAGLSGAIFASRIGSIFPNSFAMLVSINVLSLILVGGLASLPGVVVGAMALVGLPELLREFAQYRLLIYGALLIVMMLVRPEGLWPSEVRKRELRTDADEPSLAVDDA
ncbi:MAG: branched-chain amino acid ABC transporter permease [Chloroflexi bacterium]|nr:branched-chain amino acid ABC transporter permease [Chloroflexota bacterium]